MGVFKRAFLYISRKKARSFLLFLIMLLMGLFMLVGVLIRSSAAKAAEDVRKSKTTGVGFYISAGSQRGGGDGTNLKGAIAYALKT